MVYRKMVVDHMRAHADEFLPYLADEESGDMMTPEAFDRYLVDLATEAKAVWGGEPETAALAAVLRRPITVHRALDEPRTLGESHAGNPLHISYDLRIVITMLQHRL
jgi:OTU domain-containing protein 6